MRGDDPTTLILDQISGFDVIDNSVASLDEGIVAEEEVVVVEDLTAVVESTD